MNAGPPARGIGGRRRRTGGRARVADLLRPLLGRLGLETRVKQQLIAGLWPELVGQIAARHSWAETVRDGVLIIGTDTHVWAQELDLRRGELMKRIEARVGPGIIRDLHFRGGRTRSSSDSSSPSASWPGERSRAKAGEEALREEFAALSPGWRRAVEEAAGEIGDEELRRRLRRALVSLAIGAQRRQRQGWKRCARCGRLHRRPRRLCASCARWSPPRR